MVNRFDVLTKELATKLSRRAALRGTGAGLAAGLLGTSTLNASAQEATPVASTDASSAGGSFLFVQTATSGSFSPNPGAGTPVVDATPAPGGGAEYLLTLEGHHGGTIFFSDRPERVFGDAPTGPFLENLGFSPENPPNAALVTETEDGEEDVVVLELLSPSYDEASGTITYGATILSEYEGEGLDHVAARQQDAELPERFGRSSLFIDDCPDTKRTCVKNGDGSGGGTIIGDIRVGQCYHFPSCSPCASSEHLADQCNETYPACDNQCTAWDY